MNFFRTMGRVARRDAARDSRRSRRFAPVPDSNPLEVRDLMAAGPLGINLASTMGYVDLMKEAPAFTSLSSTALATDANGWPLGDAQVLVLDRRLNQPWNGPDPGATQPDIGGTYHLSFQGQATVGPDWLTNYTVQNQVYNAASNTTTADLVVQHNSYAMLYIDFRNTANRASSTGAGVANVKLIQPGYAADSTQLFTNDMLNDLGPFGTIRYLNIDGANNYTPTTDANGNIIPVEWAQRRLPNAASQVAGSAAPGQAWEYMIALANATNTDMWINVPPTATDSYVAQLANLIKYGDTIDGVAYAGLKSNLKVYLEYGNEIWGGIYNPYAANNALARQEVAAGNSPLNNDGSSDPNTWAQRRYLQRSMQITNIFRGAFGSDPAFDQLRPVLGWQEGNWLYYDSTFSWFSKSYGAPSKYFYGMGSANYINPTSYSSVDNLINSYSASIATIAANEKQMATTAAYYGLKVVAYEGGPDAGRGATDAERQVALAASRDPRMSKVVQDVYTSWYANGGDLTMVFDGPFDTWTPFNQYSIVELAQAGNPTASPKYRGFVALNNASPQPPTAGTTVAATGTTSIPFATDSYGRAFPAFPTSPPSKWLLSVATAGNYMLTIQTGAGSSMGQIAVSTSDTGQLSSYSLPANSTTNLATLSLHAGVNTLSIATATGFTPLAMTLTPVAATSTSALQDVGFEDVKVGSGVAGYRYSPAGTAWAFAGMAGISSNGSAFTSANPSAPQGSQVAFVQYTGSISQTVGNLAAGTYRLSFQAAQRAGFAAQTLRVLVDGAAVGTLAPSGPAYQALTTAAFTLGAGSHTVTIQGQNGSSDATAFVDALSLVSDGTSAGGGGVAPGDAGFEQPAVGFGANAFLYNPAGTPWTYSGTAGVAGNGSTFTQNNYVAPQGSEVAFLQNAGSITQTVAGFAAGSYRLTLQAAQRANYAAQTLQVLVDGAPVGTLAPTSIAYQALTTDAFALGAGSHTVTIRGMNTSADSTAFIDAVSFVPDSGSTSTTTSASDPSFEQLAVGTGVAAYRYAPSGTPWVFSGSAGLSGNGSAFTSGNPAAPVGSQVGFVQSGGSIAQTVGNLAAGTYRLSFQAAQRAGFAAQTLRVLVDGAAVGTLAPSGPAYQALTTAAFTLGAGSHTVIIQGLNTTADATAFVDAVSFVPDSGSSSAAAVGDFGFEQAAVGSGVGAYRYNPSGTGWSFAGTAGISGNGSAFTSANPSAPQGSQVGFVQSGGSIAQTLANVAAGTYRLTLQAARRANYAVQTLRVLVDGSPVGTLAPSGTSYEALSTGSFALGAGSHTVTIQGLNTTADATAFVDNIQVTY